MKRRLLFAIPLGSLAVFAIALSAGYSYLRSPGGSRWLLSFVQKKLSEGDHLRLEFSDAVIDPFGLIRFKDLKLSQVEGGNEVQVSIPLFEARYRVSVLSRKVEIDRVSLDRPSILFHSSVAAASASASGGSSNGGLVAFEKFLSSPPVSVVLKEFEISHFGLDLDAVFPAGRLKTRFSDFSLKTDFKLEAGALVARGEMKTETPIELGFQGDSSSGKTQAQLKADASTRFGVEAHAEGQGLTVNVQPSDFHFGLADLKLNQAMSSGPVGSGTIRTLELRLPRLAVDSALQTELSVARKELERGGTAFLKKLIRKLALKGGLKTGDGSVAMAETEGKTRELSHRRIRFRSQEILWEGNSSQAELQLNSNGLFSDPDSKVAADLQGRFSFQLDAESGKLAGSGRVNLGDVELLRSDWTGKVAETLVFDGKTHILAPVALSRFFKSADALKRVGGLKAEFHWEGGMSSPPNSEAEITGKLQGSLAQVESKGGEIAFDPASVEMKFGKKADSFSSQVKMGVHLNRAPGLRKPLGAALDGEMSWNPGKNLALTHGSLKLQEREALKWEGSAALEAGKTQVQAKLEGQTDEYLDTFLNPENLKGLGQWGLKAKVDAEIDSPHSVLRSRGKTELVELKPATRLISLKEPVRLDHELEMKEGALHLNLSGGIEKLDFPHRARIEDLRVSVQVRSAQNAENVEFKFGVTQKLLALEPEFAGRLVPFPDFQMEGKGSVRGSGRFSLDGLTASLKGPTGTPLMRFQTEASGSLRAKNFENSGSAELLLSQELSQVFAKLADQEISGKISFPWTITLRHGRDLHFEGDLKATDVNWSKGPMRVEGVSGSSPVSEKLVWDGKRLHFASLINLNPFERVDFERFRPLVERSDRLQIERIGFEEKNYGPMNGFFSVRQNMIFANQVSFRLGSGEAAGEMYFNAYPANLQFGVLSRLTGLDLGEILPKRLLAQAPEGDKRISARSNLVMNFNRAALDGRVDVTEIGGSQLITLINVLDPKYENEQMNKTRTLLGIAYPTQVEMAFQKGFLDMGIDLSALPKVFLRGIPLSGWVTGLSSQIVKKTEGGLLK